jgi:hypothetical protein
VLYTIGALGKLKMAKEYTKQIEGIEHLRDQLEIQTVALSGSVVTTKGINAINDGTKQLGAYRKSVGIDEDKAADIMEGYVEEIEISNNIRNIIGETDGLGDEYDDDELMAEYEAEMQAEVTMEGTAAGAGGASVPQTQKRAAPVSLPEVPTTATATRVPVENDEDAEIRRLQEEMGM